MIEFFRNRITFSNLNLWFYFYENDYSNDRNYICTKIIIDHTSNNSEQCMQLIKIKMLRELSSWWYSLIAVWKVDLPQMPIPRTLPYSDFVGKHNFVLSITRFIVPKLSFTWFWMVQTYSPYKIDFCEILIAICVRVNFSKYFW